MSATLDTLINREKQKAGFQTEGLQQRLEESQQLSGILDDQTFAEGVKDEELKGFTKQEVIDAAKFALRAKPYGIDVRNVDIADSPIYYYQKGKSRWFTTRKKLHDTAQKIIVKAQEAANKRKEQAAEEQKQQEEVNKYFNEMQLDQEMGLNIPKFEETGYKDDSAYAAELEQSETYRMLDGVMEDTKALNQLDVAMKLTEGIEKTETEGELSKKESERRTKDAPIIQKSLESLDQSLEKELPSPEELRKMIDDGVQRRIKIFLKDQYARHGKVDEKSWAKAKKGFINERKNLLSRFEKLYTDVKEGKLTPEVLKVFLNSAIMANSTRTEKQIYESLVYRNEEYQEPTKEQQKEYKEVLRDIGFEHYDRDQLQFQGYGTMSQFNERVQGEAIMKGKIPMPLRTAKDHFACAFTNASCFVHFKGSQLNKDELPTDRIYVTAKPGMQVELMKVWREVMNKPEYAELIDNLHFKINAQIDESRSDNIVVYLRKSTDREALNKFMKDVKDLCNAKNILADEKHTLKATTIEQGGISKACEFDIFGIYHDLISLNIMNDEKLNHELDKAINGKNAMKGVAIPNFSYNSYLGKAMMYSAEILGKKLGIKRSEIADRIRTDEAAKKLYKRYMADFIKLAGADPMTIERYDMKKK